MPNNIHVSAIVSPNAVLGANVEVGPFTVIHDGVKIGDDSVVGSHCELGCPSRLAGSDTLVFGSNTLIRSHSVFYVGSKFGDGLVTGHRVTVREDTVGGEGLQIGTLCDIQGHCEFGEYVKMQSNVFIGKKSKIGDYVWIFPYVVLTNDPHPPSEVLIGCVVEDYAAIATKSVVLPGVRIGKGALVGAMTLVKEDVPQDTICVGVPGSNVGPTDRIRHSVTKEKCYPWRRHFRRGYPNEIVEEWEKEFPS